MGHTIWYDIIRRLLRPVQRYVDDDALQGADKLSSFGRNLSVAGMLHAAEDKGYTAGHIEGVRVANRRGWED